METKIADTENEFNQIYKLNYTTFVEEIPQHKKNESGILIDKLHSRNTYVIAKESSDIIGMLAYNSLRPFSLDTKIENLDSYLPSFKKAVEIRLLSIVPQKRKSLVLFHLLKTLIKVLAKSDIEMVLISGTVRELDLYHKIGFVDFAYLVGTQHALYQPMYLRKENIQLEFMKKWISL